MKNIIANAIIGFSIIIAIILLSNAYINRNKAENVVNVTGLAEQNFTSDLITWNASVVVRGKDLSAAYAQLKASAETVKGFLKDKGFDPAQFTFYSVDINKEYKTEYFENGRSASIFSGYRLTQQFGISSEKVNEIETLSREITELINNGIEISSNAPEYYYTKLDELKIAMLSQAAKDGELRARTIVENGGGELGKLRKSSMGVFQITAQNSSEDYSWGGSFNTSSKNKTASITVRLEYQIK